MVAEFYVRRFNRMVSKVYMLVHKSPNQIDVCLICIVDYSYIIAPQEPIAIQNALSNIKKFGLFH